MENNGKTEMKISPLAMRGVNTLRFLCFLQIFLVHMTQYQFSFLPGANAGLFAVSIFLVLSGFSSVFYFNREDIDISFKNIFSYLKKKIIRFYPLYAATTMLCVLISGVLGDLEQGTYALFNETTVQLIKNLLLIQSWFDQGYFAFNAVGWFLSTMFFMYLLNIPLKKAYCLIRKKKNRNFIFGSMIILSVAANIAYYYLTINTNQEFTQHVFPLGRLPEYVAGFFAGALAKEVAVKIPEKNSKSATLFSILELAAFFIPVIIMYTKKSDWGYRSATWIVPAIVLVFVFSFGRGILSAAFSNRCTSYLGKVSMECFLLHVPVILTGMLANQLNAGNRVSKISITFLCLTVTVLFAMLVHRKGSENG